MSLGALQLAERHQYWPIPKEWHRGREGTEPKAALDVSVGALQGCLTMGLGHDVGSHTFFGGFSVNTTSLGVSPPIFVGFFF